MSWGVFFRGKSYTGFLKSACTICTKVIMKESGCLPYLQVHLLFQLSNLCLQGHNLRLVLGFGCHLPLIQLLPQVFVLALELCTDTFSTLRAAALGSELHVHLVGLKRQHTRMHILKEDCLLHSKCQGDAFLYYKKKLPPCDFYISKSVFFTNLQH